MTVSTGLRQGEVLGLKWGDAGFEAGTLQIERQLNRNKTFSSPKRRSWRALDLAEPERELLKEHRMKQIELRLAHSAGWEVNDVIFCADRDRPLSQRNVMRAFKRFVEEANLGEVYFPDLRHSNATIMAASGVPMKII